MLLSLDHDKSMETPANVPYRSTGSTPPAENAKANTLTRDTTGRHKYKPCIKAPMRKPTHTGPENQEKSKPPQNRRPQCYWAPPQGIKPKATQALQPKGPTCPSPHWATPDGPTQCHLSVYQPQSTPLAGTPI